MARDQQILQEFKKAVLWHKGNDIVDLDARLQVNFSFYIERFQEIFPGKINAVPPNKWSYHRIGLITRGSVEFNSANCHIKAKKNYLIAMPSRMITSSKNWSKDIEGFIVLFNADFFVSNGLPATVVQTKKIFTSVLQPFIKLTDKETDAIKVICEELLEQSREQEGHLNELLAVKTYELVIQTERLFSEKQQFEKNNPVMDVVRKFTEMLENNFTEEHSVNFYAKQMNLHPNSLNALIKKHTGFTTKECIQHRLLLEIKYLLHTTSLSIKEISSKLSFKDPNYLTSFFKRAENLSPAQYRSAQI
jgi:AraC family transcriptional regulator, transcriptional activator of pobA